MTGDSDSMSGSSAAALKPEVIHWSCSGPGVGENKATKEREMGDGAPHYQETFINKSFAI